MDNKETWASDVKYWQDVWSNNKQDVPWEINEVDSNLVNWYRSNSNNYNFSCALEVGCGTGLNAVWIASHNVKTLGIDISEYAVNIAKKHNSLLSNLNFSTENIFTFTEHQKFDFIFDRGCWHSFNVTNRKVFVRKISNLLTKNGVWLSITGSNENITFENSGPPQLSYSCVVSEISQYLKIKKINTGELKNNKIFGKNNSPAWVIETILK